MPIPSAHHDVLYTQIQQQLKQPPTEPILIDVEGTLYVLKCARTEAGRWWREQLSALSCRWLFGIRIKAHQLRAGDIHYEASRLKKLHQLGLAVPQIYIQQPNYIVMEHCGDTVEYLIKHQDPIPLLKQAVDSLIDLHTAHQWHGGAQLRNLTYKAQRMYRIDFEETIGETLPLGLAQAYDVLLFFNSLTKYIQHEAELGEHLLSRYLAQVHTPQLRQSLWQVHTHLQRLQRLLPYIGQRLRNSTEVQRSIYFAQLLERCLVTA